MFNTILIVIAIVLVLLIISTSLFLFLRKRRVGALSYTLLSIELPLDVDEKNTEEHKRINFSEQLFASLLGIGEPFILEAAVHNSGSEINFYISVPSERADFTARQIQGLFADAKVEGVSDYNIFTPGGGVTAAYLSLRDSQILPLRTYTESEVDTFAQILSNMSKLDEVGEGAALQVVVDKAPSYAKKNILSAVESLKKGEKLSSIIKRSTVSLKDFKSLVENKKSDKDKPEVPKPVDEEAVKALQAKVSKQLFSVNMRVVAAGPTKDRSDDILMGIVGAYSQFSAPLRNEIKIIKPRKSKKLVYNYSFREPEKSTAIILNSEELASLFHLPTASTDVPYVKWLASREEAPPENLPDNGIVLGSNYFRGKERLVRLTDTDRRRHLYMIGQTGTGKSKGILNMAVQDMQLGNGLCVIDPHGDLVDDILERVPADRINDVIVFDPGDIKRPLGLNMLEYDFNRPEQKTFIVNEIQAIFNRLFSKETMGPMFEQYMRNTLHLLMEDASPEAGDMPATLMEVPRIMTDHEFRRAKLARIKNPTVIDFWEKEASKTSGETSLANMAPYITTKFGNFIANDYIRPIIGQARSAFDFRRVMDDGKILLVKLSKGKIGDINANLLGMIITGRILMAALGRTDIEEKMRRDFYFYIDEFQNFTTDSISTILSEARKYRLNLILAHQFIAQLSDDIREAVFGNVGSMMAFRFGIED
ncbi:MAG: type IV secretion system DNA-binding domain-containing protein, partial [Zetaproteobacteria bacterium]|nr:type IV secretion system DNA-binding domain-containing protein [Zetaproteobacteria bacterium]